MLNILGGITCLIVCIYLNRGVRTALPFVPIICGIGEIVQSIETKAQRQKRKEELQAIAKMYGWDKDGDSE